MPNTCGQTPMMISRFCIITALPCIHPTFKRRGGSRQYHRHLFNMSAHDRHITCLINHHIFLFKSLFMFFINNDEAKICKRQKQSRARADHDNRLAPNASAPVITPICLADRAVPDKWFLPESRLKACLPLRGKSNFWQENQNLFLACHHARHKIKINLCFARACYPI